MSDVQVTNNPEQHRYEARIDGELDVAHVSPLLACGMCCLLDPSRGRLTRPDGGLVRDREAHRPCDEAQARHVGMPAPGRPDVAVRRDGDLGPQGDALELPAPRPWPSASPRACAAVGFGVGVLDCGAAAGNGGSGARGSAMRLWAQDVSGLRLSPAADG